MALKKIFLFIFSFQFSFLLFGANIIQKDPTTVIFGKEAGLDRPEGIAFSPSGNCIAVANSDSHRIGIYNRIGHRGAEYEKTPSYTIEGPKSLLNYPHDVAFSSNGKHLAVANRYGNTITIYKKNRKGKFDPTPFKIIRSSKEKFCGIGAVDYSPTHKILAVADTYNNAILLFRYKKNRYEKRPCCIISSPSLELPDGVSFSPNGKYLAVAYHNSDAAAIYQRSKYSPYIFNSFSDCVIKGKNTCLKYPHSISFHPSEKYLIISSAGGKASVNLFEGCLGDKSNFSLTPVQILETYNSDTIYMQKKCPEECGAKGLSFSKDGKTLAVCHPDLIDSDKIYIFDVQEINTR